MRQSGQDDADKDFVAAWRSWVNRPPKLDPREAASRITARIRRRTPWYAVRWGLAAATAMLLVAVGATVLLRREIAPQHRQPESASAPSPIGKGEVLIWLDERTPLYMTFQAPEPIQEKGDKQ